LEILKAKLSNLDPNFPVTEEIAEITSALGRLVDVYVPEPKAIPTIIGYDAWSTSEMRTGGHWALSSLLPDM